MYRLGIRFANEIVLYIASEKILEDADKDFMIDLEDG